MNFNQLKYFASVYTYRSVSKAAEILHISQPSISNSIKELEDELGIKLFKRFHGGMEPTGYGETLFMFSKDILLRLEQTEHIMKEMGSDKKVLRLGIPPMIGSMFLPHILKEQEKCLPNIKLHITESGREELLKKLNDDLVDIIFIPHNDYVNPNMCIGHIAKFEIAFCVSEKNPLSKNKIINPHDLKDVPLVLFEDTFFQTEKIKNWFSDYGIKPYIVFQTGQLSTLTSLIEQNVASGFLFKETAEKNNGIKFISAKDKIFADVSVVWKKDSAIKQIADQFVDFINSLSLNSQR